MVSDKQKLRLIAIILGFELMCLKRKRNITGYGTLHNRQIIKFGVFLLTIHFKNKHYTCRRTLLLHLSLVDTYLSWVICYRVKFGNSIIRDHVWHKFTSYCYKGLLCVFMAKHMFKNFSEWAYTQNNTYKICWFRVHIQNEFCHVNVILLSCIIMVHYNFILIYYSEKYSGQS